MLTEADYRQRRWATYGMVESEKELQHLRHAMPASTTIPDLERCLDERHPEKAAGIRIVRQRALNEAERRIDEVRAVTDA